MESGCARPLAQDGTHGVGRHAPALPASWDHLAGEAAASSILP